MACALLLSSTLLGAQSGLAAGLTAPAAPSGIRVAFQGKVVDTKGNPLPGATIIIRGTKTGTASDASGIFHFNLPTGNEVLIISSIGFKTQEVEVKGRSTIEVQMQEDNASLDEVVVVGYGTQTKAHLTGAVASVDMNAIQNLPSSTLSATIQGQLPGVSVSGGTGRPGEPGLITVRNPSLLSKDGGTTQPLYVIDNVVRTQDDFNLLDQSEVQAISVLKDAAAAIYGARANQGVVVITTKRGQLGAPRFSYNGSAGVADAAQLPKMMTGLQQATYLNDLNTAAGKPLTDASIYTPDELAYFADHNTDWLRMAWKPALQTRHALNMSGGSDRVTYFAGFSYNFQNSNFNNTSSDKWTYRASTDVKVTKGLTASLSFSGSLFNKHNYYLKQGGENVENDMRSLLYASEFNPPYVNGLPILTSTANSNTIEATNFFAAQATGNYNDTKYTGLNLTANITYDIPVIKGLQARLLFSKTIDNTFGKQFGTYYNTYRFSMLGDHKHIFGGDVLGVTPIKNGDIVRINPLNYNSYQLNGYLTYNREFGKHQISALGFFEQSETYTDMVAGSIESVIVGGLDNMNFATGTQTSTESQTETGLLSYAGRINYSYANKYLAELAVRYDASTNFAPQYRWGLFPSLSVGWVISEEPFFHDNIPAVSFLKVRGSIGALGGDATRPYNYLTSYAIQLGKGAVLGGNGDRPLVITPNNAMANPYARWDADTKYNVGIDARFFDGRVSLTADAFYDHRYNMLTQITSAVPLVVGATLPSENYASVNGFGYEVSLGYNNRITKDWSFRLNTFFTWSDNKQILIDVPKGQINTYLDPTGQSSDQGVFGYHYAGFLRTQADLDAFNAAHPNYTIAGVKPALGMLVYDDVRGPKQADGTYAAPDGIITDADQDYLTPKSSNHYAVGFNPSITYKSFTISATMGLSYGGQATVEASARAAATATINRPAFWADHWTPDNPNAAYPSPYYASANQGTNSYTSAFWFRNSFSAGIRNANISYALPAAFLAPLHISNMNVFFVAVNPLNFYNPYSYKTYSGAFDAYPTIRNLSLGINVSL
ncbi:TonB-dependent receptor [Hymenobacter ginsengisoli]|uniref:TonB-dependent receptor n=1 Tax=Hymenobacter ginsengisoli TaxID=1051626 RepID=A0ABP8Q404_9BACT